MDLLTHVDYNLYSAQGRTVNWLHYGDVGPSTLVNCAITSGQGYLGALPYSTGADTLTSTEGSVSTGTDDANMSSPTDGGYTRYGGITSTWANQDEDYLNAGTAPFSQNLESWTDNSGWDPLNLGGTGRAPLEMLREEAVPSATIPLPEGQYLINGFHAESLPKYDVVPQVGHHSQDIGDVGVDEGVGGVTSAGLLVSLNGLSQQPYTFSAMQSPGSVQPLNNLELPTSCGGRSSPVILAQVSTFYVMPLRDPTASNLTRELPPPPIQAAPTRSGSPSSGTCTMPKEQAKKKAVRHGPLELQKRKDARAVRQRGACFACRELKQKV
jgi:hypothetical protein